MFFRCHLSAFKVVAYDYLSLARQGGN